MRMEKKELNIQIGKRSQTARENMLILYEKYKIDPTYLITSEKKYIFEAELFLANCGSVYTFVPGSDIVKGE